MKLIAKIDQSIERFSTFALIVALALMILLSLLNMALRWFSLTLLWIDPVVRYLVFACGFLGGAVATGVRKHIRIDVIPRLLESFSYDRGALWISRFITVFCIGTVGWLIVAAYQFYLVEREYGKIEFLGIHSSTMVAIVPFGLALIMFRFFAQLVASFETSNKKK